MREQVTFPGLCSPLDENCKIADFPKAFSSSIQRSSFKFPAETSVIQADADADDFYIDAADEGCPHCIVQMPPKFQIRANAPSCGCDSTDNSI